MYPAGFLDAPTAARRRPLVAPTALAIALLAGASIGCGQQTVVTMYVCTPACPAGLVCGPSGCEPIDGFAGGLDLAVTGDLAGATESCGGLVCPKALPFCLGTTCVACLKDGDCPGQQVCRLFGGSAACVPGCKDDARCAGPAGDGGVNPSTCCGGRCTDVTNDPDNCGACGRTCTVNHVIGRCVGGACTPGACEAGWGDCNGRPDDGCETDLRADASNCTFCGASCRYANGRGACANACYLAGCDFGWGDCDTDPKNGCETPTSSDGNNCGACGVVCPSRPHASAGCVLANCQLTKCEAGWSDCDQRQETGCEVDNRSDATNCGGCGNRCPGNQVCKNGGCTCLACNIPNARTTCVNNVCAFDSCSEGFGDCNGDLKDGCEVDLRLDPANCGACGGACPNGNFCVDGGCTAKFSFQASQKIDGQTVTCSAVFTGKGYTECTDFKSNGSYLANGVNCAKAWNGQNSPFSDHEGLCQSLTGSRKFEAFYLCDGGGTRATWVQRKWGTFVDNSFAQHLRCYY